MRCALCGGEIDSRTKKCSVCGECWGGGNRGIAQEVSREIDTSDESFREPSFLSRCADNIGKALSAVDKAIVRSTGKAASSLKLKTTARQNRTVAYGIILFLIAAVIIVSAVSCALNRRHELCGTWVSSESGGSVAIEFSPDGEVSLLIISGETEKVYRHGTYTADGDLLKLHYDDGESITFTFSIDGNSAVFTLLSTGESQTYQRK